MPKNNLPTSSQKIIVIVGPTASGKSDLSIKLAKKYNGEIISADSRQVYRGMDIGTGKVRRDRIKGLVLSIKIKGSKKDSNFYSEGIRHHLIDIVSPKKQFTAHDFKRLGEKAIKEILANGKIPIIVGGTGFYIDILLGRMVVAEVPPNKKLRAKLEKQSVEQLYFQLLTMDHRRAQKIDRHNKRRLVRALEIAIATKTIIPKNKAVLQYFRDRGNIVISNNPYDILFIGIKLSRKKLERRIKIRLDQRLKQSIVGEVKNLIKNGVNHKRLQKFGLEYKWISLYLQNKISYLEMENELLRDIIRYSKRQMTWFKRNKEIRWIKNRRESEKLTKRFFS